MQAILITLALEGYESLADFCANDDNRSIALRAKIMAMTGILTRQLHDARLRHNSLYAKHFFVKKEGADVDVRIIDLERLKWLPFYGLIRHKDLSRIIRRGGSLTMEDLGAILSSYYQYGKDLRNTAMARELNALLARQERSL